jgi:hypothetical protein
MRGIRDADLGNALQLYDDGDGHPAILGPRGSGSYRMYTIAGSLQIRRERGGGINVHFRGCKDTSAIDACLSEILGCGRITMPKMLYMSIVSCCIGRRVCVHEGALLQVALASVLGRGAIEFLCRSDEDNSAMRFSVLEWGSILSRKVRPCKCTFSLSQRGFMSMSVSWSPVVRWEPEIAGCVLEMCDAVADLVRECC